MPLDYKWGNVDNEISVTDPIRPLSTCQSLTHTTHDLQTCQTDSRARGPRFQNNCHQYVYRKCTGKSYEDGGGVIFNHIEGHWADLFVLKGNAVLIACLFLITVALLGIGASLGLRMGFYGNAFWSSSSNSLNVLWRRLLKKWCLYNDFQWVSQWETSWIPENVTFWQTISAWIHLFIWLNIWFFTKSCDHFFTWRSPSSSVCQVPLFLSPWLTACHRAGLMLRGSQIDPQQFLNRTWVPKCLFKGWSEGLKEFCPKIYY